MLVSNYTKKRLLRSVIWNWMPDERKDCQYWSIPIWYWCQQRTVRSAFPLGVATGNRELVAGWQIRGERRVLPCTVQNVLQAFCFFLLLLPFLQPLIVKALNSNRLLCNIYIKIRMKCWVTIDKVVVFQTNKDTNRDESNSKNFYLLMSMSVLQDDWQSSEAQRMLNHHDA